MDALARHCEAQRAGRSASDPRLPRRSPERRVAGIPFVETQPALPRDLSRPTKRIVGASRGCHAARLREAVNEEKKYEILLKEFRSRRMKKTSARAEYFPAKRRGKLTPAETVRMLRELQEMSQSDLAEASGIPQPVISAIENGNTSLGVDRAKKLARALRVHPAVILFSDWDEKHDSVPTGGAKRSKHVA